MKQSFLTKRRRTLRVAITVLGLFALVMTVSQQFRSQAIIGTNAKGDGITRSYNPALENYDIRLDKAPEAADARSMFRQSAAKSESDLATARKHVESAISDLNSRVPDLKIDFSPDLDAPEVIGTDVLRGAFLTGPSSVKRDAMVRGFLNENKALFGLTSQHVNELVTVADYTNPSGNLSYVDLQQQIDGIPVFRGEVRAVITNQGEIARMINNLAPGLDYEALPKNAGNPADAVTAAARTINHETTSQDLAVKSIAADGKTVTFERGQFADPTTAEMMYFPLESGVARLAWRVLLWEPVAAYYVVVDAETGKMLWRKNITNDQTQTATYGIYNNDSPAPLSPTNATPGSAIQGAGISRTNVTLIGNEAPNPGLNNLGWITDGANVTDGNNVEAGLDLVAPDGVDAPVAGSPTRVFDFTYNPPPLGADVPSGAAYRNGVVTNLFYWTNRYHDFVYNAGFTEPAKNFQNDNFSRGGAGADRIRGEAQDSSGTNNANFSTPADGGRGRMQMYLFTGPSPQRDGSLDGDVFIHEMTHGTSNRLIGNGSGLTNNRGGSMGEGWSDFYGRMILSSAGEDVNAVYAAGAYVTINFSTLGTDNYYYGIRRFPYAVKTNLGGPMSRPHNPTTLADIDPAQINTSDGAYPIAPWIGNTATEVHNAGEVWCMMLLEVRARIITRLGFAAGNQRMLQITTDGMKVTPTSPNFIQARDAILAADQAGFGGSDTGDIWAGFATRGAGFGATDGGTAVVQSFNLPNIIMGAVTFTDAATGNNNGVPDPGETIVLTVPLQNPLSDPITGVSATIAGSVQNYGTINGSTTVNRNFNYLVPAATPCGSGLTVPVDIAGSAGAVATTFTLTIGAPVIGVDEKFDTLVTPALPAGWTTAVTGSGVAWVSSTTTPDTAPNAIFTTDPGTTSSAEVVTSNIPVASAAASVQFRLNYSTELGWDGMVLEMSIGAGPFQDIITAGGAFTQNGYPRALNTGSANPLTGRSAWTGNSGGYVTVKATLPAAAAGQNVKFKFRHGSDGSVSGVGVRVDGLQVVNGYTCAAAPALRKPVSDFDGDGRTDVSVYRGGTWYLNRSTAGFTGFGFGLPTDTIVPGDYDGDGKADAAVYRTNTWFILKSSDGTVQTVPFGTSGDIPMTGDYDGDHKADTVVYRPSSNVFFVLRSSNGTFTAQAFGAPGDVPVAGDFDGDGTTDFAVFRNGSWFVIGTTAGFYGTAFGMAGDHPVPGDYDGDGKTDIAVVRGANWYLLRSTAGFTGVAWGFATDTPVPGDYDGDGKTDVAVFRNSDGGWYVSNSGGGTTSQLFGTSGDKPTPAAYVP